MVQRRNFPKDFKCQAVDLVLERGFSIAQAFRRLGLNDNLSSRWIRGFRQGEQKSFPDHGTQKRDDSEVTLLKRELEWLRMEGDILKKLQPSLPRSRYEVWLHSKVPKSLAD